MNYWDTLMYVPIENSNYEQREVPKEGVVMHWIVGRESNARRRFRQVGAKASAHYAIDVDGDIVQYIKNDEYVAYHAGDYETNTKYIGIEHAGGWLVDGNTRKKPTSNTHEASAELLAKLSQRHGWGTLIIGTNVFPHNTFSATQCPGSLDLEWIVDQANKILQTNSSEDMTIEEKLNRIYDVFLGRKPDEEGFEYYKKRIESGKMDEFDVAGAITESPEWKKKSINVHLPNRR